MTEVSEADRTTHISGILVHAPEDRAGDVAARIEAMAGAEVYAREGGKLAVVLEAGDEHGLNELFNEIALMENVYSAALVSHYLDEPDRSGGEACN